jgi:hypothetical protein
MAAKFDQASAPDQPALILGKFKTAEDLAQAYTELEKKLGAPADPAKAPPAPPAVTDGKVDWAAVQTEITSEGGLQPATAEALTKMGIPQNVIDGYVSSLQVQQQTFRTTLETEAGGAEQFETIRAWAGANLQPGEKAALQKMVEGGIDSAKLAIQTMRQRYESANGAFPSAPAGGKAPGAASGGYASTAEMVADMKSPKYASDPAFRKMVEDRIATAAF